MIQKIKQKLISIYLSRRKLFNILGIFLLVGLLIIFINLQYQKNKRLQQEESSPQPTSRNKTGDFPTPSVNPFMPNPNETYFINQIVTNLMPVTGYSWNNSKLIYSTPDGIYEAGTNNVVLEQSIESIVWANSFNAVFKSNGVWKKLDYKNKRAEDLPGSLINPTINTRGDKILDRQKNVVKLFDLTQNTNKEVSLEEPVNRVFFIENTDGFIFSTSFNNKTHVHKYDKDLEQEKSIEFEGNLNLSSISPDGTSFVLILGKELKVADFLGTLSNNVFSNTSGLLTGYVNSNKIIVIERYKDSLGRSLENIYLSNLKGNKFKISDSKSIINRINIAIPIAFSKDGAVVSFIENNGKIWILALTPNMLPTYSTKGILVFSIMNTQQGF